MQEVSGMDFSNRLKELRESQDITQEQLAKLLNVSRPTIAGYETRQRQPDYEKLILIADLFNVSVDFLLTGESADEVVTIGKVKYTEEMIDQKVDASYQKLGLRAKASVMEYIYLLELREKYDNQQKRDRSE